MEELVVLDDKREQIMNQLAEAANFAKNNAQLLSDVRDEINSAYDRYDDVVENNKASIDEQNAAQAKLDLSVTIALYKLHNFAADISNRKLRSTSKLQNIVRDIAFQYFDEPNSSQKKIKQTKGYLLSKIKECHQREIQALYPSDPLVEGIKLALNRFVHGHREMGNRILKFKGKLDSLSPADVIEINSLIDSELKLIENEKAEGVNSYSEKLRDIRQKINDEPQLSFEINACFIYRTELQKATEKKYFGGEVNPVKNIVPAKQVLWTFAAAAQAAKNNPAVGHYQTELSLQQGNLERQKSKKRRYWELPHKIKQASEAEYNKSIKKHGGLVSLVYAVSVDGDFPEGKNIFFYSKAQAKEFIKVARKHQWFDKEQGWDIETGHIKLMGANQRISALVELLVQKEIRAKPTGKDKQIQPIRDMLIKELLDFSERARATDDTDCVIKDWEQTTEYIRELIVSNVESTKDSTLISLIDHYDSNISEIAKNKDQYASSKKEPVSEESLDVKSAYDELGLDQDASHEEVTKVYTFEVGKYLSGVSDLETYQSKKQAYETLRDHDQRQAQRLEIK